MSYKPDRPIFLTDAVHPTGIYILRYLHAIGHRKLIALGNKEEAAPFLGDEILAQLTCVDVAADDLVALEDIIVQDSIVIHLPFRHTTRDYEERQVLSLKVIDSLTTASMYRNVYQYFYLSSILALGTTLNGSPVTERSPWQPDERHHQAAVLAYSELLAIKRAEAEGLPLQLLYAAPRLDGTGVISGEEESLSLDSTTWRDKTIDHLPWVDARDIARYIVLQILQPVIGEHTLLTTQSDNPVTLTPVKKGRFPWLKSWLTPQSLIHPVQYFTTGFTTSRSDQLEGFDYLPRSRSLQELRSSNNDETPALADLKKLKEILQQLT